MFLVTAKVITLVSFYSPSLVCSVFFFHSFCQDQHSVTSILEISFCSLQFSYFFGQESRKFLRYQHLVSAFCSAVEVAYIWHGATSLPHSKVLCGRCGKLETAASSAQAWKQSQAPCLPRDKGCPFLTWQDMLHTHSPPPTHLGTAVFQLQYNRP